MRKDRLRKNVWHVNFFLVTYWPLKQEKNVKIILHISLLPRVLQEFWVCFFAHQSVITKTITKILKIK